MSHYRPERFADLLRAQVPQIGPAPSRHFLGFYWTDHVRGVRDQPAFRQLVEELGLVGYWQLYGWPEVCRPVGVGDFTCDG